MFRIGFPELALVSGVGLLVYAAPAIAASSGPSWEYIANGIFGMLLLVAGTYAKGVKDSLNKRMEALEGDLEFNRQDIHRIELLIIKDYQTRADVPAAIKSGLDPLKVEIRQIHESLNALHHRLDKSFIDRGNTHGPSN